MSRALYKNIIRQKKVSGGSTLTMQVIRLYKKNSSRSLWHKITETILAVRLEISHSKREILALYTSNAPFGSNVVGLDAAAWRYYGRSPHQLSWGEMAALAVLPNSPSLVHPGKNRDILLKKRNELLDKLLKNKIIDSTTCHLSKLEPLPSAPKALPQLAPHLAGRFKKEYAILKQQNKLRSTGIQTTIDRSLQQQVNSILERHHHHLKGNFINNAAAMVIEVESGNILSYVGNIYQPENTSIESYVDVLASVRSPGSTLKPLLYASLLSEGAMMPGQLIADIPTQIGGYTPQNFDLGYDGAVPANRALARSLNIPAVKMLQQYKYQRFYHQLKQFGFTTLNRRAEEYGMSLILGGCEISPYELAGVYSSMARMYLNQRKNQGEWNGDDWFMPKYIKQADDKIQLTKNRSTASPQLSSPLLDYTSIWHTLNAMNEVARPGEQGLWDLFSSAQRIAWKTGTSFGFRDGWAIGLTPKFCVLVWTGNTTGEGRPELTGINTAAPVLFDIFRILPASGWFEPPVHHIHYVPACHQSGFKASAECDDADTILVSAIAKNNAPLCPYHKTIHLDRTGNYRVSEACESPSNMQHASWFVLPPAIEYYYRQRHADYKLLPPYMPGCIAINERMADVIYPEEGAKIYVPVEVTGEKGKTIFTATHRIHDSRLFWHLDDTYAGTTQKFHQLAFNPSPGKHVLTIVDENGESVARHFEILDKQQ